MVVGEYKANVIKKRHCVTGRLARIRSNRTLEHSTFQQPLSLLLVAYRDACVVCYELTGMVRNQQIQVRQRQFVALMGLGFVNRIHQIKLWFKNPVVITSRSPPIFLPWFIFPAFSQVNSKSCRRAFWLVFLWSKNSALRYQRPIDFTKQPLLPY